MGITLAIARLSDAAIDEICADPRRALHFWMQDEAPPPKPVSFIERLLGKKQTSIPRCSVPREPGDETDLDKAWDAMDYLLSDKRRIGGQARFLTESGTEVPEEIGYGPPRVIRSAEVKEIAAFLDGVSPEVLRARFDGQAMDKAEIYPQIWTRDGDEGVEYVVGFLKPLRDFVAEAAKRNSGLMLVFT